MPNVKKPANRLRKNQKIFLLNDDEVKMLKVLSGQLYTSEAGVLRQMLNEKWQQKNGDKSPDEFLTEVDLPRMA